MDNVRCRFPSNQVFFPWSPFQTITCNNRSLRLRASRDAHNHESMEQCSSFKRRPTPPTISSFSSLCRLVVRSISSLDCLTRTDYLPRILLRFHMRHLKRFHEACCVFAFVEEQIQDADGMFERGKSLGVFRIARIIHPH